MSDQMYEWIPNIGVGPVKFGTRVQPYIDDGTLRTSSDSDDGDEYSYPDETLEVDADERSNVEFITKFERLVFGGKNLVGMTLHEVNILLGQEPDEVDDPIEFDDGDILKQISYVDLGLLISVRDDIVVNASVHDASNNEEPSA